ncbi:mucin-5AC-like [Anopheles albimanus]|uniref:mucin-5AC-like n=1 Tax=Anopheles albimanus TaxID=7167 RepID=UPI00164030E4|nr:mucin-5AC-like [Anopheles albimanus]
MGTPQRRTADAIAYLTIALPLVLIVTVAVTFAQDPATLSRPFNDGSFKLNTRTSFSCAGRVAGYYADVETGCQIYHMCDGLGRQFSYACPNTTLFQQRMLICDHWYMVNCSKAESNYAANLLIGQRDKPFVPEEENEIRTPRPDLLDRPDALDFGGPSLKNFFKSNAPALQNAIFDAQARNRPGAIAATNTGKAASTKKSSNAEIFQESASNHGLPIHWGTRFADETPDRRNSSGAATERTEQDRTRIDNGNKRDEEKNESRNTVSIAVTAASPLPLARTTSSPVRPSVKVPSRRYEPPFLPEELSRRQASSVESNLNTVPTTQARFNGGAATSTTTTARPQTSNTRFSTTRVPTTTTTTTTTKAPTIRPTQFIVGPTQAKQPAPVSQQALPRVQPSAQFVPASTSVQVTKGGSSTISTSDPRQSSLAASPILFSPPAATAGLFEKRTQTVPFGIRPDRVPVPSRDLLPPFENIANFDQIKTRYTSESIYTRPSITNEPSAGPVKTAIDKLADAVPSRIPSPAVNVGATDKIPRPFSVPAPANDLLPPHKEYVFHDDATTQGPPIYYQWKWSVPSFGLDPPGLEAPPPPPAAATAREVPGSVLLAPTADVDASAATSVPIEVKPDETERFIEQLNPATQQDHDGESGSPRRGASRDHNQSARSISSETGNLGENRVVEVEPKRVVQLPQHNYLALRQQFAIPDFTFPLDGATKGGQYGHAEAVDSFQVRIPSDAAPRTIEAVKRSWYGENARCPECHPSFLRPGSCEPCVKVRR